MKGEVVARQWPKAHYNDPLVLYSVEEEGEGCVATIDGGMKRNGVAMVEGGLQCQNVVK